MSEQSLIDMLRNAAASHKMAHELEQSKLLAFERMPFLGTHLCDLAANEIERLQKQQERDAVMIAAKNEQVAELRAEVERLKAEVVPEGWKPVPIKPTGDMCFAGCEVSTSPTIPAEVYLAMLTAAPQPPTAMCPVCEEVPMPSGDACGKCGDYTPEQPSKDYTAIDSARDDEREGIALFLTATGRLDVAAEIYAGMVRPIDKDRRNEAAAVWDASRAKLQPPTAEPKK